MAITNIRQQVLKDFRDKLKLEPKLGRRLRIIDREIVQQFRRDMLRGEVTSAEDFRPELEAVLLEHYGRVEDKFGTRISDQMPDDVAMTPLEKAILGAALATFFTSRAIAQSRIITATTQRDMHTAAQIVAGETADQVERAVAASSILSRRLRGREGGIASLETQAAAEAVKGAQLDVLVGKKPLSLERVSEDLKKEWVTLGDEVVRPKHVQADSQVQPVSKPFIVGSQLLRWPGDTALGASVDNVIYCRCSAVYDTAAVVAIRVRRDQVPVFDPVASPTLIISIGDTIPGFGG